MININLAKESLKPEDIYEQVPPVPKPIGRKNSS